MELEKIEKIVNDYGKALDAASQRTIAASDILLPYPKKTIKNAIKFYLVILSKLNKLDEALKNHLMMGYAHLADFIPEKELKIVLNIQAYMLKSAKKIKNKDTENPKRLAEIASNINFSEWKKAIEIQKQINKEFNQNLSEIEKFVGAIK